MNDFVSKVIDQFSEFFAELDVNKRMSVVVISIGIIVILGFMLHWASKDQYRILFTNLNQEDSSTIARMLEEKKINYLVSDDGQTISVPEDQVEIWRLELAKQGVNLTGSVGYEVFDNQSFGTTSFVQKINKQRALEGELTKTIKYISGVQRARVHLSIPDDSPFVANKKPPSASVVLELGRGVILTPEEIRGIASLVASSVDGMRVKDVVIIDSKGKRLSENIGDAMTAETANRISLEGQLSQRYEGKVEEILSKVVGDGKVIAKVSVNLDFTQVNETETVYDGENAVVLSEVVNSQKLKGSRPSPQGLPGARTNLPGEEPRPGIPETKNDVDKSLVTRNFNVPSKVKQSKTPTAKIKNISVAVMIDGKQLPQLDESGIPLRDEYDVIKTNYESWSEAEIKNFEEIVSTTLGLNTVRGDQIVIRNMKFISEDLAESEAMIARLENRKLIRNVVKYAAIGILLTLFFLVVVRPFMQWVTENTVESVENLLPQTIEDLEKLQAHQKLPGLEDALPVIEEKMNPEKVEGNMLKEKITSLIEANPAKAAQVIHNMIHAPVEEKSVA